MTFIITFTAIAGVIFCAAYAIARRYGNSPAEAVAIAIVAALFGAAAILVPGGQSEF